MTSRARWIPLGILLLAFTLRVIALNTRAVWYDEAFAVFLAEKDFPAMAIGTAADTMPPLYYALLHFWLPVVGETPFAMRMLSVAISMLSVALVYAIGTRGVNPSVGRWAMFLTALASFQLYHAQELRMYSILALGLLVYLYGVMRLDARWSLALVALATALALYAHNLAFLTLIAANVYLALHREWRAEWKLLGAQFGGAVLFLAWLLYVPGQLEKIQRAFWTQPPGLADVLQMLVVFTAYLPLPPLLLGLALFLTTAVCAFAAIGLVRLWRRGAPSALGLWLAVALVPPALMFALSYFSRPIFVPRGVIVSSLAYYLVLAALAARLPTPAKVAAAGLALIITLGVLPYFYTAWGEWRRAPFAAADQFLRSQVQPGDLVLHDNKLAFFPMRFYDRALPQEFLADPPASDNDTLAPQTQQAMGLVPVELDAALQRHPRVWFVIFQTALDQAAEEGHPHGNISRLDGAIKSKSVTAFGDLRIFLYENR